MSSQGGFRGAVTRALAIDRTGFKPLIAIRGAIGVAIPFAIGAAAGHAPEGAIAAAGALPAGIAGLTGGFKSRVNVMLATALGMAVSTFVGGLVAGHLPVTLGVLVVWGFAAGIAVAISTDATIVGTQAVMGLVVFGRFPGSVSATGAHAGLVLAGGAFQALLAGVVRSPQRYVAERRTLAQAYTELARLARNPAGSSLPAATRTTAAQALIARRSPNDDLDLLRGLADEASRIRLELSAVVTVLDEPTVRDTAVTAAGWLDRIAAALYDGKQPAEEHPDLERNLTLLTSHRDDAAPGRPGTGTRYAHARTSALLGQLRAANRLATALAGVRRIALPRTLGSPVVLMLPQQASGALRRARTAVRDPSSSAFRHAVRLAVLLPACEALSHVLPWQRGYWVTLTAALVLKPDYAATAQRGLARVGGTGLGVVAAGLIVVALHPSGAVLAALIALATWAAYTCFAASYALYSFGVTAIVVLLLTPIGGNDLSTVADRGLDTLVGGAIAMLAYAAWPTWERMSLATATTELLEALAAYADVLLSAYEDPSMLDRSRLGDAATTASRARMAAQASHDRAVAEPARGGADLDRAAGILAATRRIVIELHALRVTLEDADALVAIPAVADSRHAVVAALRALAAGSTDIDEGLRDKQQRLDDRAGEDLDSLPARRRALVAAHLDPLVDSIDTIAHVMG